MHTTMKRTKRIKLPSNGEVVNMVTCLYGQRSGWCIHMCSSQSMPSASEDRSLAIDQGEFSTSSSGGRPSVFFLRKNGDVVQERIEAAMVMRKMMPRRGERY